VGRLEPFADDSVRPKPVLALHSSERTLSWTDPRSYLRSALSASIERLKTDHVSAEVRNAVPSLESKLLAITAVCWTVARMDEDEESQLFVARGVEIRRRMTSSSIRADNKIGRRPINSTRATQ
jgi:hypothetical protein